MERLVYKGQVIEYIITRKKVKNINMRINADMIVRVSADKSVPEEYLKRFIYDNADYIIKCLDKCRKRQSETRVHTYEDGDAFYFKGRLYSLRIISGEPAEHAEIADGYLNVYVKFPEKKDKIQTLIKDWYKCQCAEIFEAIARKTYDMLKSYGIAYPKIRVRDMKSRWGSCIPAKNVITLNRYLIESPEESIEYVVLHEFAHLLYPNHSKNFYRLIENYMPDYKVRKKDLNSSFKYYLESGVKE